MKTIKPILITLILAGATYGAVVLYGQLILLKKITTKFLKYRFDFLTINSARLIVTIEIENTSDMDFVIRSGNFDVFLNDIFVSKVITNGNSLEKKSVATIDLQIDFSPKTVLKNTVSALLADFKNIKITIDGKVTLLSRFFFLNNYKVNETVNLSELLLS